jgi:hypothetical protein
MGSRQTAVEVVFAACDGSMLYVGKVLIKRTSRVFSGIKISAKGHYFIGKNELKKSITHAGDAVVGPGGNAHSCRRGDSQYERSLLLKPTTYTSYLTTQSADTRYASRITGAREAKATLVLTRSASYVLYVI